VGSVVAEKNATLSALFASPFASIFFAKQKAKVFSQFASVHRKKNCEFCTQNFIFHRESRNVRQRVSSARSGQAVL
jgi:hypothetical protein